MSAVSKVVVTGAAGYIGGRLVSRFGESGWDVHAVVREPAERLHVAQSACDLAQPGAREILAEACRGADTVVHLAGDSELRAAAAPAEALARTVVATERLSEACAAAGVSRVVYMSTVHVYGDRILPGARLSEDMRVEPRSVYAISRLASEHVAASLAAGHYELVILRLTNSVGAPSHPSVDRWSLVANDLCRQGTREGMLTLRSSGAQWRDFVPLADVCEGIVRASHTGAGAVPAATYNLASGCPRTVRGLAELVQDAFQRETGTRPPLEAPDPEPDPPSPYTVATERAAAAGVQARGSLEDAIAETVRFCLSHREELPT